MRILRRKGDPCALYGARQAPDELKYSPRQYAEALSLALEGKSDEERKRVLKNFLNMLARNRAGAKRSMILRETERQSILRQGLKKVAVESADPLPEKTKKEIAALLGNKLYLQEKINPDMLAGIKILVNDELLIDASAKTRIDRMLSKTGGKRER